MRLYVVQDKLKTMYRMIFEELLMLFRYVSLAEAQRDSSIVYWQGVPMTSS